uniref:Uncharacterized protein n=1 Tax=Anguilla anguilla TaxID=7936 RepID=A0A0E9V6L7_ANGAN
MPNTKQNYNGFELKSPENVILMILLTVFLV